MTEDASRDRGDIWISDVLEAWRRLGLETPEQRVAAAEALGFDAAGLKTVAEPAPPVSPGGTAARDATVGRTVEVRAEASRGAAATLVIPTTVEEDTVLDAANGQSWLTTAPPLQLEQTAHTMFKPPHIPLLRPHWTRHLMSGICAVQIAEGVLDEPRLVDAVTRLRPVIRMPRRLRPTLRRGVQVLIDRGEAMTPFSRDVDDLVRSLLATVGREQFVAAAFVGTPLVDEGVLWLRTRQREPWHTPAAGTPVLVITDLGLSQRQGDTRGATAEEWIGFARQCRTAGCPTLAILPRDLSACPPALRRAFSLIPWDPRTNVATVLKAVRVRS